MIDEMVLEQRLSTIELSSGEFRQVSPPDLYVYEYDWSPDGTQCVAIAARGPGDNNWYIAQLYVLHDGVGADDVDPRSRRCRSPCRAGRRTGGRSPLSAG